MKVLFIGEGRHDVGDPNPNAYEPRTARGTIPTLARRIAPNISDQSVALAWTDIQRFNPAARKRGYQDKVPAAALLAARRFECDGSIFVADRDGKPDRFIALEAGMTRAKELFPRLIMARGLAIESVEAWTLGASDAIAQVLDIDHQEVQALYPAGVHIESLGAKWQRGTSPQAASGAHHGA